MSRPESESGRLAVALGTGGDGQIRVLASAQGRQAEELIERARGAGVEVQQDARRVEELLREESKGSNIPLEVYELMATVINFAQELNEARSASEGLPFREELERGAQAAEGGDPL